MAPAFQKQKDWKTFDIAQVTQEEIDRMEDPIGQFFEGVTKAEFFQKSSNGKCSAIGGQRERDFADPSTRRATSGRRSNTRNCKSRSTIQEDSQNFPEGACQIWRRAPLIGEHNQEIYGQELGMSPAELAKLKDQGVI